MKPLRLSACKILQVAPEEFVFEQHVARIEQKKMSGEQPFKTDA